MYNGYTYTNDEVNQIYPLVRQLIDLIGSPAFHEWYDANKHTWTPDGLHCNYNKYAQALYDAIEFYADTCNCVLPEQSCPQCRAAARKMVDLEFGEALPY